MFLSSILAGKFLIGKITGSKIAGISFITSTVSDVVTGSVTYHYWDKKKKKSITIKNKHKKRRW